MFENIANNIYSFANNLNYSKLFNKRFLNLFGSKIDVFDVSKGILRFDFALAKQTLPISSLSENGLELNTEITPC